MRKYIVVACFLIISFFINLNIVEAATCSNSEQVTINNSASSIQASYSLKKENNKYVFYITIYNITKNTKVRYSSDSLIETEYGVIDYSRTNNGTYKFSTSNVDEIVTYTFVVLSNSTCDDYEIRSFTLIKPQRNSYFDEEICKYEAVKDYYYCKEWITNEITYDRKHVIAKIEAEIEKNREKNIDNKKNDVIDTNTKKGLTKEQIIIVSVIGSLIVLIIILIIIKMIRIKRYEI